jgi:TrmH family RNA methyltransferase
LEKLRMVLVGIEGAVNLGMLARLADNFEVEELYLVSPKASIEEAERFAARAYRRLYTAVVVDSLQEALEDVTLSICTSSFFSEDEVLRASVAPWEAAELAAAAPGVVALVFGRESVGLTRSEIAMCTILSSIPANPSYPSLNVTNAAAIYLYEIYRARRKASIPRGVVDSRLLALVEAYSRALASLLAPKDRVDEIVLAVRRLAGKSIAARREVEGLLYLLSRACRKLEGCMDEVSRHLQPGDGGRGGGGDRS